jgi:putative ABC transport system substrate-binding protein
MIPARAAKTFFDRLRNRRWRDLRWLRACTGSTIAALLLTTPIPASSDEKPIVIGALALGPRNVPAWHCGPQSYQPASVERRPEIEPFYVLGLRDELKKLKYLEDQPENLAKVGRRFAIDLRMGPLQEIRGFVREFVRKPVDLIFAVATATVQIAREETRGSRIPIVMASVSDPVGEGFAESLARPGGLITGISHQMVQGSGKRVELFKQMIPGLRRLITIRRPGYRPSEESMREIRPTATELKIDLLDWGVTSRDELQAVLAEAQWQTGDGIMILPDTFIISNVDLVIETSLEQHVPALGIQDYMADWGALAAYGPSAYQAGALGAQYVNKISKGAKPGDLPIEPIDPTFVINLKAAACLGITIPLELLREADRIIR